jgi:hypothetical protein
MARRGRRIGNEDICEFLHFQFISLAPRFTIFSFFCTEFNASLAAKFLQASPAVRPVPPQSYPRTELSGRGELLEESNIRSHQESCAAFLHLNAAECNPPIKPNEPLEVPDWKYQNQVSDNTGHRIQCEYTSHRYQYQSSGRLAEMQDSSARHMQLEFSYKSTIQTLPVQMLYSYSR